MSLNSIIKDDFGQDIELTFIDVDTDAAADISAYSTTITMIFKDPAGTETTKTSTFKTDGSDGVITYTVDSGFIAMAGQWRVRGQVKNSTTATLTSEWHKFAVLS